MGCGIWFPVDYEEQQEELHADDEDDDDPVNNDTDSVGSYYSDDDDSDDLYDDEWEADGRGLRAARLPDDKKAVIVEVSHVDYVLT